MLMRDGYFVGYKFRYAESFGSMSLPIPIPAQSMLVKNAKDRTTRPLFSE